MDEKSTTSASAQTAAVSPLSPLAKGLHKDMDFGRTGPRRVCSVTNRGPTHSSSRAIPVCFGTPPMTSAWAANLQTESELGRVAGAGGSFLRPVLFDQGACQ